MPKRRTFPQKYCLTCGEALIRKWFPICEQFEAADRFAARLYCSKPCASVKDIQPIGTEAIRKDRRHNSKRYWIKIAERRWKKRAVVVWENANGPLMRGYLIHHKDRNQLNDSLDNLQHLRAGSMLLNITTI